MVNPTSQARYPRERDPVRTVQEAGWATGSVWTGSENLAPPPGFDPRTVQPLASSYTRNVPYLGRKKVPLVKLQIMRDVLKNEARGTFIDYTKYV